MSDTLPPIAVRAGPIGWMRRHLFRGPVDTAITLVCLWVLWQVVPPMLDWAFLSAQWSGDSREACTGGGAAILGIFHDAAARDRVCDRVVDVRAFAPKAA